MTRTVRIHYLQPVVLHECVTTPTDLEASVSEIQLRPVMQHDWPRPAVMLCAVVLAWEARSDGYTRLMQSWIARQMGVSRETVSRAIAALVEADIVRKAPARSSYRWNPDALADLDTFIARIPDNSERPIPAQVQQERQRPASARPVPVQGRAEPYTLNARQLATLARMRAERAALEARHGEENVYGGEQGLELVAPHTADDDCIALDPMPATD